MSFPLDMNPEKTENLASIYGVKERKRLAAVRESNALIGVAVTASKAREKQERKRLAALHRRNTDLRSEAEDHALTTAYRYRASTTATILFIFCIVVLLLYSICSIAKTKKSNM